MKDWVHAVSTPKFDFASMMLLASRPRVMTWLAWNMACWEDTKLSESILRQALLFQIRESSWVWPYIHTTAHCDSGQSTRLRTEDHCQISEANPNAVSVTTNAKSIAHLMVVPLHLSISVEGLNQSSAWFPLSASVSWNQSWSLLESFMWEHFHWNRTRH